MPSIASRRIAFITLSLASFLSACAAKGTDYGFPDPSDAGGDARSGDPSTDDGGSLVTGGFGDASAPGTSTAGEAIFYAHDNRTLYKVDATDPKLGITRVGDFDCIGTAGTAGMDTSMTDIAVDRSGRLFGVGPSMVFSDMTIHGTTVECLGKGKTLPTDKNVKFFGASFAPVGTVDANAEALVVGNTDGDLYKVDISTGALTLLGNFGVVPSNDGNGNTYPTGKTGTVGKRWELSGDIVFLENNGTPVGFATVRDCPNPPSQTNCSKTDTLIELDLKKLAPDNTQSVTKAVRGKIVKAAGCPDNFAGEYGSMYGIAAYKGDIIGFSRDAFIVKIDNNRGAACRIADDVATVKGGFAGAGITTLAPVVAPPPR